MDELVLFGLGRLKGRGSLWCRVVDRECRGTAIRRPNTL
jgi:hypothetical protein